MTTTAKPTEIRLSRAGEVFTVTRVGEVFSANAKSGGRMVKRWFHSETPTEEQGLVEGFGFRSARQAAEALVKEAGE